MPVKQVILTSDQETRLSQWLFENLETIRERRLRRTEQWKTYRDQYEGKTQRQKNFPWKNASNVYVPITGIITDAIHANMMNRIFGHERVWDVKAMHVKEVIGQDLQSAQPITWAELAKATQDYLGFESSQQGMLDVYDPLEEAILECVKLGTAVIHNPWTTITQPDFALDQKS